MASSSAQVPNQLHDNADSDAAALARLDPEVYALAKRQTREPLLARAREQSASYGAEIERLWTRPRTVEALRAYVERTLG